MILNEAIKNESPVISSTLKFSGNRNQFNLIYYEQFFFQIREETEKLELMETLLEPEAFEKTFNKSGSVYVLSDDGECGRPFLRFVFSQIGFSNLISFERAEQLRALCGSNLRPLRELESCDARMFV